MVVYLLLLATWTIRWVNTSSAADWLSYQARTASSFVDSIGINIHLNYTIYSSNYDAIVKPKLQALGVSHARQGLADMNNFSQMAIRFSQLSNPTGGTPPIKFDFVASGNHISSSSPHNPCFLPKLNVLINGGQIPCGPQSGQQLSVAVKIEAMESANEPDHCPSSNPICGGFSNPSNWFEKSKRINDNWPDDVLQDSQLLRTALRNNGPTTNVEAIAPSLVWLAYYGAEIYPTGGGSLLNYMAALNSYVARGNTHPYCHVQSIAACYNEKVAPHTNFFSGKPIIVTETGHSTADYSEKVQAKYTTSILFDFFARGVERTYIYELLDDPNVASDTIRNYGLINEDGREKPAYVWLKNAITLLTGGGSYSPGMLEMNISAASDIQKVLLQKNDGSFWLQYDKSNRTDSDVTKPVTIGFRSAKNISYYNLESTSPYQTDSAKTSITLNVPDRIALLKITNPPITGPTPTPTPTPGGGGGVSPTPTTTSSSGNRGSGNSNGIASNDQGGNSSGSTSNSSSGKAGTKKGSSGQSTGAKNSGGEDSGGFSLGSIKLDTSLDRVFNATVLVASVLGLIFILVALVVTHLRLARRKSEYEDVDLTD